MTAFADDSFVKVSVDGRVGYISHDLDDKTQARELIIADRDRAIKVGNLWQLSPQQVEDAENAIPGYLQAMQADPEAGFGKFNFPNEKFHALELKNASNEIGLVRKNYDRYERQYVGVIVDGKKSIMCNFFWLESDFEKSDLNPLTRYVDVNDGGYRFWHVIYDVEKRKCFYLDINGPWELDMMEGRALSPH